MVRPRRFAKEFEEEVVRLVQTSGRTQHEIAGDLGNGAVDAGPLHRLGLGSTRCFMLLFANASTNLERTATADGAHGGAIR